MTSDAATATAKTAAPDTAAAISVLTKEQEASRELYLAAAKRHYMSKYKQVVDSEALLKRSGLYIEELKKQVDFGKMFDENGQPRAHEGAKAPTLEEFLKDNKRATEFNLALDKTPRVEPTVRQGAAPLEKKPFEMGKWVKKVTTRAEGKLSGSIFRQCAVGIGLICVIDGLVSSLVPHKEETVRDGIVIQDGSAARLRGLLTLAGGVGVATGAALI